MKGPQLGQAPRCLCLLRYRSNRVWYLRGWVAQGSQSCGVQRVRAARGTTPRISPSLRGAHPQVSLHLRCVVAAGKGKDKVCTQEWADRLHLHQQCQLPPPVPVSGPLPTLLTIFRCPSPHLTFHSITRAHGQDLV